MNLTLYRVNFLFKFRKITFIMKTMTFFFKDTRPTEKQGRTRQKIIDAAIDLHQTKGLAGTTIRDIAQRAKVGNVTVYRHFPDEEALVDACSGQYFQCHPFPDIEAWRCIQDASQRLRRGLRDSYAYHRETEPMMTRILSEARDLPVMGPYHAYWRSAGDAILAAWPAAHRKAPLKAGLALALSFDTWHLLVRRQYLADDQAINLMMRLMGDYPGHE